MNKDRFKFRVWDNKKNQYVDDSEVELLLNADGGLLFGDWHGDVHFAESDYIIEQCTGLSDKNGKPIYEGDCVGFYVYEQDGEWYGGQGTVVWHNSSWGIETSSHFIRLENNIPMANPQGVEIIGNIHEHKEQI